MNETNTATYPDTPNSTPENLSQIQEQLQLLKSAVTKTGDAFEYMEDRLASVLNPLEAKVNALSEDPPDDLPERRLAPLANELLELTKRVRTNNIKAENMRARIEL